jgi:hypothetical protein
MFIHSLRNGSTPTLNVLSYRSFLLQPTSAQFTIVENILSLSLSLSLIMTAAGAFCAYIKQQKAKNEIFKNVTQYICALLCLPMNGF